MPPLLALRDVTLGYRKHVLLRGLSLAIQAGDFWGVVGPNGSGKTTLLKTIVGILQPVQGGMERESGVIMGYVPQRGALDDIFPLTALDVVLMGRYPRLGLCRWSSKAERALALAYLEKVGIAHAASRSFRDLSGGQKQRALLARALAMEPDVLVLDEPTEGMDIAGQHSLMELICRLHQESGRTILMSTHTLTLVANYAQQLLLLHADGNVFEAGTTRDLLVAERLRRLYGLDITVYTLDGVQQVVVAPASRTRTEETPSP
jgi:ABC-type Mn2+/Zn2+ transport system ATPase subunit